MDSASARIQFLGFGTSFLALEVFSYVTVTDALECLEVAEDLNICLMDIVAAADSGFAFTDALYRTGPWARCRAGPGCGDAGAGMAQAR